MIDPSGASVGNPNNGRPKRGSAADYYAPYVPRIARLRTIYIYGPSGRLAFATLASVVGSSPRGASFSGAHFADPTYARPDVAICPISPPPHTERADCATFAPLGDAAANALCANAC